MSDAILYKIQCFKKIFIKTEKFVFRHIKCLYYYVKVILRIILTVKNVRQRQSVMRSILILVFLLVGCGTKPNVIDKKQSIENDLLIDVRSKEEFESESLKRSIHVPHDRIGNEIEKFTKDKNTKIVLFCRSGARAGKARQTLIDMGYLNVINIGGYSEAKEKYPD